MTHPIRPDLVKRVRVGIADRWLCRDAVCQMRHVRWDPVMRGVGKHDFRKRQAILDRTEWVMLTRDESLNNSNRPLRFR